MKIDYNNVPHIPQSFQSRQSTKAESNLSKDLKSRHIAWQLPCQNWGEVASHCLARFVVCNLVASDSPSCKGNNTYLVCSNSGNLFWTLYFTMAVNSVRSSRKYLSHRYWLSLRTKVYQLQMKSTLYDINFVLMTTQEERIQASGTLHHAMGW